MSVRLGRNLTKNGNSICIAAIMVSSTSVERMKVAKSVLAGVMVAAVTLCAIASTVSDPASLGMKQAKNSISGRALAGEIAK